VSCTLIRTLILKQLSGFREFLMRKGLRISALEPRPKRIVLPEGVVCQRLPSDATLKNGKEAAGSQGLCPIDIAVGAARNLGISEEAAEASLAALANTVRSKILDLCTIDEIATGRSIDTEDGFAFAGLSRNDLLSAMSQVSDLDANQLWSLLNYAESFIAQEAVNSEARVVRYEPLGRLALLSVDEIDDEGPHHRRLRRLKSLAFDQAVARKERDRASREYDSAMRHAFIAKSRRKIRFRIEPTYFLRSRA
jgi:hypothetical protein